MHKKSNIGQVELATISFGQSFQITPIQLATTVSSIINGGRRITPHFGVKVTDEDGNLVETLQYPVEKGVVTEEVSGEVRYILEKVVSEGSRQKRGDRGQDHRRQDSHVPDTAEKCQPVYLLLPGIYTG